MNGLLFLVYCIEILGPLLCGAENATTPAAGLLIGETPASAASEDNSKANSIAPASETQSLSGSTSVASSMSKVAIKPTVAASKSHIPSSSPSPTPHPTIPSTPTPSFIFYSKECLPVLMVAGGLILLCFILLISTLMLMCKVCQLNKHIKMLSSNADLISTTDYWMGTAKKNKDTSETEAKETTVLMTDISQTVEEVGNGTTKEDGGKVNEEGKAGEEDKKEEGDTAKSEEASAPPVTVAEDASSSKPQEEATDSQSTKAEATSSSTGTEEQKDAV